MRPGLQRPPRVHFRPRGGGEAPWALTARSSSLEDSALGVLDDYEVASRSGERARAAFVQENIGSLCAALVAAAGAVHGRNDLLRVVATLRGFLWGAPRNLIRDAVVGIVAAERDDKPRFVESVLKIAVERVSDSELSTLAADSLATLYGSTVLEDESCVPSEVRELANEQTKTLVSCLITEIALSASPSALAALGALLRRDFTRTAFCNRDGVSTLAATLRTDPSAAHTSIGEAVAADRSHAGDDQDVSVGAVAATYHAAFAVWMLSFGASTECVRAVLQSSHTARLVLVCAKLLDHVSGRRLKIARVVLATLRNLATGDTELHTLIRREMVGAGLPIVLEKLGNTHDVVSRDVDAAQDIAKLVESLSREQVEMTTMDVYVGELQSGALRWTPIHINDTFWAQNAEAMVTRNRGEVLSLLTDIICAADRTSMLSQTVACSDLARLIRFSVNGRRAALSRPKLKAELMSLMADDRDSDLRNQALTCVQLLLLTSKTT